MNFISIRKGTYKRIYQVLQLLGLIRIPLFLVDPVLKKKIIMRINITSALLIFAFTHATANGFAQINLNKKNVAVVQVLEAIKAQTNYVFIYDDKLVANVKVSISAKNAAIDQVLKEIFKDLPITFEFIGKDIVLKAKEKPLLEKIKTILSIPIDVRGVVRDASGNPLSGAIIRPKGSVLAFSTNANGEFFLRNVEENKTILVSYVGYVTQEISAKKEMSIVMQEEVDELNEVSIISTGFQELDKERATGSYAKPDMEVFKNRTGTTNIITRLEGLIPGMTIIPGPRVTANLNRSGNSSPNQSIIRGASSIRLDPDPLFVVNNVMVDDISSINPDDVADITVLKDAAAAAIWGARAANGVIVITTKTGGKQQKLKFNYSSYLNFQGKPDLNYRPVLSSSDFIKAARETFSASNYPLGSLSNAVIAPHELILYNQANLPQAQVNARLDSLSGINNQDQISELFYRNAISSNQTLSVSSGGEKYAFYGSLSYNNNRSNRPGEKNELYRLNLSQDINPTKRIHIGLNTTVSNSNISSVPNLNIDNQFLPYQLFKDAAGNSVAMPYLTGWSDALRRDYELRSRIGLNYVPLDEAGFGNSKGSTLMVNLNANVKVDIWKGLSFRGTYGYLKSPSNSSTFNDIAAYSSRRELLSATVSPTQTSVPVYYLPTTGGRYSNSQTEQNNWTVRNMLSFQHAPRGGQDRLLLEGGNDVQEQFSRSTATTVYGYDQALMTSILPDYATLNRGINAIVFGNRPLEPVAVPRESLKRFVSWFALFSYSFAGKYNLDASWRIDHSNSFGQDKSTQNKPVWSIGGKWLVAKEGFMKNLSWLNEFSVRATYGIAGNSPYAADGSNFNILNADFGTNPAGTSLSIGSPANNRLLWEVTRTKNLGLDISILKNRLALSFDVYDKKTTDLLGPLVLNPITGYNAITGNLGELNNKGIDLSIRTLNLQLRDFTWSTNLVLSYNKNELKEYGIPSPFQNNPGSKVNATYFAGYSLLPLFAYRYAGLDAMGDPMIRLQDGTTSKAYNVAKTDDVGYQGTIVPKVNGGFSNTFTYKGLSLSANMIFNLGHVMRRDVNEFYTGRLTGATTSFTGNIHTDFNNRWKNPGDEAFTDIPAYVSNINDSYGRRDLFYYFKGDVNVLSASYVKLRDVTMSYTIPAAVLRPLKIQAVNVFVQATNFMIWKNNDLDIDPEFHNLSAGTRNIPPFKHSFSVGTNITF
jgi:TonB-linked SusC/RagA family outer membrane protein